MIGHYPALKYVLKKESTLDYPRFDLQGQVAVVTGASKGIGYGLANALANAGAKVAVAARDTDALERLAGEIRAEGGEALPVYLDVRDVSQIRQAMQHIASHFGQLDILVNNAGLGANHPALDVTEDDWDTMMDVNLKGLFFCAQAAGRIMLERGYGRIINMSSQASVVGIRDHAVYCASKGGVNQLTRVLALEWSARGVTVNAVGPTFIYTPGTAERLDNPAYLEGVLNRLPIGHVGTITDVAGAVIYLASPAAAMVTGTILLVDAKIRCPSFKPVSQFGGVLQRVPGTILTL
jgi:NAD(P)-dependent dehydrogenase (short-subunit alcohol dehydrogenase family)